MEGNPKNWISNYSLHCKDSADTSNEYFRSYITWLVLKVIIILQFFFYSVIFLCFLGCPSVTMTGASNSLILTTSGTSQSVTCSSGTFPGGFSTQQFICNTATNTWVPNPASVFCHVGKISVENRFTAYELKHSELWNSKVFTALHKV